MAVFINRVGELPSGSQWKWHLSTFRIQTLGNMADRNVINRAGMMGRQNGHSASNLKVAGLIPRASGKSVDVSLS